MEKLQLNKVGGSSAHSDTLPASPKYFLNGSYSLEDFPNEIWAVILLYLPANDLLSASATTKRLLSLSELAWKAKCFARYNNVSVYYLYVSILNYLTIQPTFFCVDILLISTLKSEFFPT